jgi:hypothetical protein
MPDEENLEPCEDGMHPPDVPTEVFCLHCQKVYESYLIEWRVRTYHDGQRRGFWSCPMPDCDGVGFGIDIFPTDPEAQNDRGFVWCNDDDEEEGLDEEIGEFDQLTDQSNGHAERPPDDDNDVPY